MKKLIATLTILATLITTTYAHAYPLTRDQVYIELLGELYRYSMKDDAYVDPREDLQPIIADLRSIEKDTSEPRDSQLAQQVRRLIEACQEVAASKQDLPL